MGSAEAIGAARARRCLTMTERRCFPKPMDQLSRAANAKQGSRAIQDYRVWDFDRWLNRSHVRGRTCGQVLRVRCGSCKRTPQCP